MEKDKAKTKVILFVGELKKIEVKKVVEVIKQKLPVLQAAVVTFYKDRIEFLFKEEFYDEKADLIE